MKDLVKGRLFWIISLKSESQHTCQKEARRLGVRGASVEDKKGRGEVSMM